MCIRDRPYIDFTLYTSIRFFYGMALFYDKPRGVVMLEMPEKFVINNKEHFGRKERNVKIYISVSSMYLLS